MQQGNRPLPNPTKSAVALSLTFIAGITDVVGFLTLHHVFTAHVSGTTAHLGIDVVGRRWSEVAIAATVVGAFLLGSVMGRVIIEIGAQTRFRRIASITFAVEAFLLILFVIDSQTAVVPSSEASLVRVAWLLGSLGCAMGIQTATVTRIGSLTIHTTFVTGMINKLAQLLSHILFETYYLHRVELHRQAHYRGLRDSTASQAVFIAGIWIVFLSGCVAGTALDARFGPSALYLAVFMLACVVATDWIRPLSLEEEKDQSER
jgi:uncharacterized membrane protein YoaK (UPF0700 family)